MNTKIGKLIFLIFLLVLKYQNNFSQNAEFERDSILIGDTVSLNLTADFSLGKVYFPLLKDSLVDGIEIIGNVEIDTVNEGKTLRNRYIVQVFKAGKFELAGFPFLVNGDTIKVNTLALKVAYIKPDSLFMSKIDTTQIVPIADIKEIEETPWTFAEFWKFYGNIVLAVLFVLLLAAAVMYFIIRKMKNKPVFSPVIPNEPAHVTALRNLILLKEKKLPEKGKIKEYYTELTDIFRQYIEKNYNIPAPEFTTNQLIAAMKHAKVFKSDQISTVKQILLTADLVKFAKAEPLQNENDLYYNNTYNFIEQTKIEQKTSNNEIIALEDIKTT